MIPFWTLSCARWEAMDGRLKHTCISAFLQCSNLCSFFHTALLQTYSTLLVDIFLDNSGTAAASGNIRCGLSALGAVLVQPLVDGLGRGWYFNVLSALSGIGGGAVAWAIRAHGMEWRGAN
jgi:hypothetical protein